MYCMAWNTGEACGFTALVAQVIGIVHHPGGQPEQTLFQDFQMVQLTRHCLLPAMIFVTGYRMRWPCLLPPIIPSVLQEIPPIRIGIQRKTCLFPCHILDLR